MAETLGSLCDKLIVIKLKQLHSQDQEKLNNLTFQENLIKKEINEYVQCAVAGLIPIEQLSLPANKVYQKAGDWQNQFYADIGELFSALSLANCNLWHIQEKAYEFDKVPPEQKDALIEQQSIVNLERNKFMDEINAKFYSLIKDSHTSNHEMNVQ